jgi:hypothetical protein
MTVAVLVAAATGFILGARHGLDWDHLSAVADLVGTPGRRSARSLGLAAWYCVGHGSVVVLLGAMVGVLGMRLPGGLDRVFEVVVGATLIGLGLLVLVQVARERDRYRFTSRWRLVIDLVRRVWLRQRGAVEWDRPAGGVSRRAAFTIGVLHGTGAETPTQVVLFGAAAAMGSTGGAVLVLVAFVSGLIVSDLGVAAVWLSGRLGSARIPGGQAVLGALTGAASIGVGAAFVVNKSGLLPAVFGG